MLFLIPNLKTVETNFCLQGKCDPVSVWLISSWSPSVGIDATFLTQIYLILFHMKDEKL